jgi:hypothetical protein
VSPSSFPIQDTPAPRLSTGDILNSHGRFASLETGPDDSGKPGILKCETGWIAACRIYENVRIERWMRPFQ